MKYKKIDTTLPHEINAKKGVNENDIIATVKKIYKNILVYSLFIDTTIYYCKLKSD
jgi:hypothetical protein